MNGTGNDFVVIDDLENKIANTGELALKLCDRRFGIGGDGILLVRKSSLADIAMEIINADGSYASMCGNGIRCFAKYVWEKSIVKKDIITIETGDGIKTAKLDIKDNKVSGITINMGFPSFEPNKIPAASKEVIIDKSIKANDKEYIINTILMGVPHTVILGKLDDFEITEGKAIEKYVIFPQGTNVNFCEVVDECNIRVKTWERGAGATLACGTGCCASAVIANRICHTNKRVSVEIPGGSLTVEITNEGVLMTGPAEVNFVGEINI
jgi:diaminopimelate epimerase